MPDFNLECPICKFIVKNERGLASHFRHQSETHPDYREWKSSQKWVGKTEPRDYVTCMECGHRAASLTGHIRVHKLSSVEYRSKYGADSLLKSTGTRTKRIESIKRARSSDKYEGLKDSICTECGKEHKIHKLSQPMRCDVCIGKEEDQKWVGKSDPEDYVTCLECGYRAESLVSHINSQHSSYREEHPDAIIVALCSSIRDKSHLEGVALSEETKNKMSENAGRWNRGLTAETDERVLQMRESIRRGFEEGRESWSKGLTMEDSESLQSTSRSLREWNQNNERHWSNPLVKDLTMEDFQPYIEQDGTLDHFSAVDGLECCLSTIYRYAGIHNLTCTDKYVKARHAEQVIVLTKQDLEPYMIGERLDVRKAKKGLGHGFGTIRREALNLGIKIQRGFIKQMRCLDSISKALGGSDYIEEWNSWKYRNPETGYMFKYDGYFPEFDLIVEFHGYQHYTFPNAFHKTEEDFEKGRQKDRQKRLYIDQSSHLTYFCVLAKEPFDDVSYLRGRLYALGVITEDHLEDLLQNDGIITEDAELDVKDLFGC